MAHPRPCVVPKESGDVYSKPAKRVSAANTPNSAPPAIRPDAIRVPRSRRASLSFLSAERLLTNQATRPPISIGVLSCSGMNIPRQNARAGTPSQLSNSASIAPTI